MSIKTIPGYAVVCDWPGCGIQADYGDYAFWFEASTAVESLDDDWYHDRDGERHYCDNHPVQWASDLKGDDGDPPLTGLHLLIHDGDTGNPDDDGKVSLIEPTEGGEA